MAQPNGSKPLLTQNGPTTFSRFRATRFPRPRAIVASPTRSLFFLREVPRLAVCPGAFSICDCDLVTPEGVSENRRVLREKRNIGGMREQLMNDAVDATLELHLGV